MKPKLISIIIPVRNEHSNLISLIKRIHKVFNTHTLLYEIIAVDDYSTDGSYELLESVTKIYPVKAYKKQGVIGKGNSLVEGVSYAKGDALVLIDADLSYPPEEIIHMIERLDEGDLIIGNRIYMNGERKIRKFFAKISNMFFGKVLFGLDFDVQSGLKLLKSDVVKSLQFNPSQWSFDLELIYKASHAGYTIIGHPIRYGSRKHGIDKLNIFQATLEYIMMAIKFRFFPTDPIMIDLGTTYEVEIGWQKKRYKPYTKLLLENSAIKTVNEYQLFILLLIAFILIDLFIINWQLTLIILISSLTVMYFSDLLFNLYLIFISLKKKPELQISKKETDAYTDWPSYTIICPLYKEWSVVPQFTTAISNMDYPKDKLQVLLVLEEDDKVTQEEIGKMTLPPYFQTLVTPHAYPKTKPKACNYALLHSNGDYVVIYDAEDIPDPLQLKKAVVGFHKLAGQNVVCLQAKLNFYNTNQNLLTRLFTLEYSLWFDLILTGLHSIGAPIPLGGTSNHFKRKYLDLLQGWDPFNVTEDCDLGIRLFKYGYKTKVLDSVTLEEGNSSFFGWFPQRTRWNKGYIQTYLVHMRRPHDFISDWSNPHLLTFQLIVGGKIISTFINPVLWLTTIAYFAFRYQVAAIIEPLYVSPFYYLAVLSLIFGNFLYFYYYMIAAARRGQWDLVKYSLVVPFYWIMMSVASWFAVHQIFFRPHYWDKTKHGLHLKPVLT